MIALFEDVAMEEAVPAGMKRCCRGQCRKVKPSSDFNRNRVRKDGLSDWCKECCKAHTEKYRKNNPERVRDSRLMCAYGVSVKDYQTMLAAQSGVCAICKSDKPGGKYQSFCVDHCHATGQIRDLLCRFCNLGIGNFKDDVGRMLMGVLYLLKWLNEEALAGEVERVLGLWESRRILTGEQVLLEPG